MSHYGPCGRILRIFGSKVLEPREIFIKGLRVLVPVGVSIFGLSGHSGPPQGLKSGKGFFIMGEGFKAMVADSGHNRKGFFLNWGYRAPMQVFC